ncbi:I78 family peptidase inhibitor [Novosphingobium sp. SG720]|nr:MULTISPECIES: I78 family peptidase inhibitor [unclassified Novosphingobium]
MLSLRHLATACAGFCLLAACGAKVPKPGSSAEASTATPLADGSDAVDAESLPAINCGEGRLAALMHQPENDETHAAVIAAVGHRHIRWVHPGDAVTMDYQPGRLNVIVDEHGQIAATRCG